MRQLVNCLLEFSYLKEWANFDDYVIGTPAVKALAREMIQERRESGRKITFNELETFFQALESIALSNVFHSLQAADECKDTTCSDMIEKDNHPKINPYFHEVNERDFLAEQIVTDLWHCILVDVGDAKIDPTEFESDLLVELEEVIIFSYRLMFKYIHAIMTGKLN